MNHPTHIFSELIESRQERGLPVLEDFYRIRRRQLDHDALTTATRQMQPTGKRTIAVGRSIEGGGFVVTCNPTLQPEPV